MDTITTTVEDNSPAATPSTIKSEDSTPPHDSSRGSPPPNCAICLGTCRNKSFTDSCLHQFCFKCLLTWSKVKAECPLCKQNFKSIIHNVQSNHQYEEYLVQQHTEVERLDIDNLTTVGRRFRYRTTLTLPRRETLAIQRLLLQYPLVADVLPPAPPAPPPPRRRSPAAYRRTVYRHNLWARPLPDFTGRYRDCSPEFYRYNVSQVHRLVPWLNRELHYLLNENAGHIAYVLARIVELLPRHHITSPEFRNALQRYFGERTEHFLHELYCFASTPFDLTGYDRNVHYTTDSRLSSMVTELSSTDSDSADSDIVMVSSSHPAEPPPGPSRAPAAPHAPPATVVIPIETISHSDSDDSSSEVMVVGYIKPPAERTPEVVDLLGSDSDVVVQEEPAPAPAPAPLVRLSLKRAASSSTPPGTPPLIQPAPHASPDREWRPPSDASSSSSSRDASSEQRSPAPSRARSTSSSSSSSATSSSMSPPRRKRRKKVKGRRRSRDSSAGPSERRRRERKSRRRRREVVERERRGLRKSSSGRGVKSSRRAGEAGGASGARRLRSVVTVAVPAPPPPDSDSSDDLPLNLSLHKHNTSTQL